MLDLRLVQSLNITEHRTKIDDAELALYQKRGEVMEKGTILFVHGSSMAARASFDFCHPGRPGSSAMETFAAQGFDTWAVDMRGYGRSDKRPGTEGTIAEGAADLVAATQYILDRNGGRPLLIYGSSSGALRAALFAQDYPERVARLALDAFVWTGENSPTLAERRKKLSQYPVGGRRPMDRAFVHSIFTRDHPGTADDSIIDAFADITLEYDTSVPTGTYIDMCLNLPVVDPLKIAVPTLLMRGEYDGVASIEDLLSFFAKLPNADKQFAIMPGIAHAAFQQKNYLTSYQILYNFFTMPPLVYPGG